MHATSVYDKPHATSFQNSQRALIEHTVEKPRGKKITFTHLFPQLNKKYNYNDIADLSNSSLPNVSSPEKKCDQKAQSTEDKHEKTDQNDNEDSTQSSSRVKDWLSEKNGHNEQNLSMLDKTYDDVAMQDIHDATATLDITQQVDNRHAALVQSRLSRASYDRMSNFGAGAKIRSYSADSKNKKDDEEDNESFASCAEEIRSRSSSANSKKCMLEDETAYEKKYKVNTRDLLFRNADLAFEFDGVQGGMPSTMTTIQASNNPNDVSQVFNCSSCV